MRVPNIKFGKQMCIFIIVWIDVEFQVALNFTPKGGLFIGNLNDVFGWLWHEISYMQEIH